jgi:1,4-dihydroxy-2-naphthoate octaprenyltransferase
MAVGFLYSGGPRPISFTPIGEPVAGGTLGSVLLGLAYLVASGSVPGPALWAALPQGLFVAAILAANNACDIEGDRASGRRTLAVLVGPRIAPLVLAFYVVAAFAAATVLVAFGLLGVGPSPQAFLALAAAASFSAATLFGAARAGFSHEKKSAVMRSVSIAFFAYSLAIAVALA